MRQVVMSPCLHGGAGPMSIFLPDFDIGRLASRRKWIRGRKMLFAFACGCATRFMMFHARPLQKPKSEVQQTWLQQVRCALLWNTSNHICLTMNFVQWMLCSVHVSTKKGLSVWIEDSTVFVGGLNFDTTSEGRAMRPVCVPWTFFCTVQSNSNPAEQLPSELWTVYSWTLYGFAMAYEICRDGICARFTTTLCSCGRSDLCSNLHCEGHWQAKRPGSKWIMTVLAHVPCAVCAKAAARWNTKRRRLRNWLFKNLMVPSWMVGSCMWLVEQLQDSVTQITFKQSPFSWAAG